MRVCVCLRTCTHYILGTKGSSKNRLLAFLVYLVWLLLVKFSLRLGRGVNFGTRVLPLEMNGGSPQRYEYRAVCVCLCVSVPVCVCALRSLWSGWGLARFLFVVHTPQLSVYVCTQISEMFVLRGFAIAGGDWLTSCPAWTSRAQHDPRRNVGRPRRPPP